MIREANLADFEAVAALENQIFNMHFKARPDMFKPKQEPLDYEYYEKCLDDEAVKIFLFEQDGRILGHCFTRRWEYKDHITMRDMPILEIDNLCVDESERGRQIGKALFERAKEYAKEIGAAHLELTVWGFNKNAEDFYEHLGMSVRISRLELVL